LVSDIDDAKDFVYLLSHSHIGNKAKENWITYNGHYLIPSGKGKVPDYYAVWRISPNEYVGRGDDVKEAKKVVDLLQAEPTRVNARSTSNPKAETRPSRKRGISIRVRSPGKKSWYWFARNKDGKYVVEKEGVGRQFSYLDVGENFKKPAITRKPGLQGLAFNMGFPVGSGEKIKPGQAILAKKLRVQKIWIEKAVLSLPDEYTTKKLENTIKKKYGSDIKEKLGISDFKIISKGKDYQLEVMKK
jgi:hypothetical protein